jgi:hypothetical protein
MLLVFALRALKPGNTTWPHYLSNLSAHVEFSDAIRVMDRAGLIEGLR